MAAIPTPSLGYTKEVRFAVVMYGGVSLAIYINGVAQELLRMVRSTAKEDPTGLTGSELIYREISQLLGDEIETNDKRTDAPTRFVVDIISGTSAGGINGVFLAKALANEQDIKKLEGLWIQQGEITTLINDGKSLKNPLQPSDPPTSLLNSQRMYLELLNALDGMDEDIPASKSSALVNELDLFVTATDIRGIALPIRLADRVVAERRHRNVLHFVYSKRAVSGADQDRNDFEKPNNPFLAYAARCTSAFPFAFEPMRLEDIDEILDGLPAYQKEEKEENTKKLRSGNPDWQMFYKDYLSSVNPRSVKFPQRSFNDGGVLDNKPFSYATETLAHRYADVPVDRKLIYIEPSPEHPEEDGEKKTRPNAIENVRAALSLPRNETIREDVQRVLERNRLIHRTNRIMRGIEKDSKEAHGDFTPANDSPEARFEEWKSLGALAAHPPTDEPWAKDRITEDEWEKLDLADMIKRKGKTYLAYHRLQLAELTDLLAALVTRVGELDEESDYFAIIRGLLKAWRDDKYTNYREKGSAKPTMNQFLIGLGLSYPIRRLNFLRKKVDKLYRLDEEAHEIINSRVKSFWPPNEELPEDEKRRFREALRQLKSQLNQLYIDLRLQGRQLRSRPATQATAEKSTPAAKESSEAQQTEPNPIRVKIKAVIDAIGAATAAETRPDCEHPVMEFFLGNRSSNSEMASEFQDSQVEEVCAIRAADLLNKHPKLRTVFDDAAGEIEKHVRAARTTAHDKAKAILYSSNTNSDVALEVARTCLHHYYERYDDYDMVTFPIFYETDVGESDVVEIIRVSPEDARALINERDSRCQKLAGASLGHFGAFLKEDWRKNDILWGRLDGAERIISALVPDPERAREFIGRAQSAILWETIAEMGPDAVKNLLVEAMMRPSDGVADDDAVKALSCYLESLRRYGDPALAELIKVGDLTDYYRTAFKERSRLEPESTLRTAARATTVIGKVLSGISNSYGVSDRYAGWVVRLGQIFWGLVEVAVPQSFANIIFQHWLKLIFTFEVLAILGGVVFAKPQVTQFGWIAFVATATVNAVAWWLSDVMRSKGAVRRFLVVVVTSLIAMLTVIGALKVASVWFGATVQDKSILSWLHDGVNAFGVWLNTTLCVPNSVISFTWRIFPILVAVALVIILWLRAGFGRRAPGPKKDKPDDKKKDNAKSRDLEKRSQRA